MVKHIYPTDIEELKHGDLYQWRYPFDREYWSSTDTYNSNIGRCKKERFIDLIKNNNLRIIKITK